MSNRKTAIRIAALVGALACFLPLGGAAPSLWKLRGALPADFIVPLVGFSLALAMTLTRAPLRRSRALTAVIGFGFALLALADAFSPLLAHGGIGGRLLAVAAMVGLCLAVWATAWPESLPE